MLGLTQKISCEPFDVGGAIGNDTHFAGAGHHVYAADPLNQTLGSSNINIAGTGQDIHRTNCLRAIGHGSHRPGTSDTVNLRNIE